MKLGIGEIASTLGAVFLAACSGHSVVTNVVILEDAGADADVGRDASAGPDAGGDASSCVPGAVCAPNGSDCQSGTISCATGAPVCASVKNAVPGTDCGGGKVCDGAGGCVACADGILCSPGGNTCQSGVSTCSSGSLVCNATGSQPNGFACGTNEVCFGGACTACVAGQACLPNGNPCQVGTTSCATGQVVCVPAGDVADGTTCGAEGLCCGGGCAQCTATAHASNVCAGTKCTPSCNAGFSLCGASCVDTTSDVNACGPTCAPCPTGSGCVNSQCVSNVCSDSNPLACGASCVACPTSTAAATCTNGACVVAFGPSWVYQNTPPCIAAAQSLARGVLYAEPVTIPVALSLTGLGVIGHNLDSGVSSIMTLYTDAAGAPGSPVAGATTPALAIGEGRNVLALAAPVSVAAGTYWIAAQYGGANNASICMDSATTNQIDYVADATYGTVPSPFASAPTALSNTFNIGYFVAGTPQ